jgi:hypothetical protein
MRPPSIRTSAALVSRAVTTVPLRMTVFTLFLFKQYGAHGGWNCATILLEETK